MTESYHPSAGEAREAPHLITEEQAAAERAELMAEITPENLVELAETEAGRARIRDFCLDANGIVTLPDNHHLAKYLRIEYLYRGECLKINGIYTEYAFGRTGRTYFPIGDTQNRVQISYGTRIEVVPENRRPILAPQLQDVAPLSPNFERKVSASPVSGYLYDFYQTSDKLGRGLLDSSRYSGLEISSASVQRVAETLKADGLLTGLESQGWDVGPALLVLPNVPQTLLLIYKARSGQIVRMRRYTISTGKGGIGTGENQTPDGTARLRFNYVPYNEDDPRRAANDFIYDQRESFEWMPIGTVFLNNSTNGPRITGVNNSYSSEHPAVMTTRIMKLYGLESGNRSMQTFYVHGTNRESQLGSPASGGCVRMSNIDVIELTRLLPDNDNGVLIDILTTMEAKRASSVLRSVS